jgi:hypothetical protein
MPRTVSDIINIQTGLIYTLQEQGSISGKGRYFSLSRADNFRAILSRACFGYWAPVQAFYVDEIRMFGGLVPALTHLFMTWYLIHRRKFTFYLYKS